MTRREEKIMNRIDRVIKDIKRAEEKGNFDIADVYRDEFEELQTGIKQAYFFDLINEKEFNHCSDHYLAQKSDNFDLF